MHVDEPPRGAGYDVTRAVMTRCVSYRGDEHFIFPGGRRRRRERSPILG